LGPVQKGEPGLNCSISTPTRMNSNKQEKTRPKREKDRCVSCVEMLTGKRLLVDFWFRGEERASSGDKRNTSPFLPRGPKPALKNASRLSVAVAPQGRNTVSKKNFDRGGIGYREIGSPACGG